MCAKNVNKEGNSTKNSANGALKGEMAYLPLAQKIFAIKDLPPSEKMDRIISDPEAEKIIKTFSPQEMYWLIKEVGENDSLEIIKLSTHEQTIFSLDMECWKKDEFVTEKFYEWLGYLLEGGEKKIIELLTCLDMEFLTLCLLKTITVGGGIGEFATKEEVDFNWDHTFDNCYFISYRNANYAPLLGRLIDIIFRNNHPLYLALMESLRHEIASEMEELNYQLRSGRLGDLGFPAYEDAVSIYAYLDPSTYTRTEGVKHKLGADTNPAKFPIYVSGDSLLKEVLLKVGSEELSAEFNNLVNNAIVAETTAAPDMEHFQTILERVHGYLNIALEFLSGNNSDEACAIFETEPLKKLFQLGRSLILPLRKTAGKLLMEDNNFSYAANRALLGLKANHPKFYRGMDADMADGYREFGSIDDIRKYEVFLNELKVLR
ncbi:MAG TPA: DUF6178 family protein [Geobacteraceae bacterium]|nr:DUF6178 family protein [Geobacteraceae bacterium]